jgi:3-deoxy-D-manno-octulosonate 8-phosphate phosphatase KdsC-like HAD superfamily phosphatase
MKFVGLPFAVADAFPEVRAVARHVLSSRGGQGAVREIALAVAFLLDLREREQRPKFSEIDTRSGAE